MFTRARLKPRVDSVASTVRWGHFKFQNEPKTLEGSASDLLKAMAEKGQFGMGYFLSGNAPYVDKKYGFVL